MTGMLDPSLGQSLCLVLDGELKVVPLEDVPNVGAYLSGSVLRCFVKNEGYFDVELLTGERTQVAGAQLADSGARILLPNCIFESNLFQRETPVEAGAEAMRFFDGQVWHDVALPEELLSLNGKMLVPCAVLSDCVMFSVSLNDGKHFYRMALDTKDFALEYCGMFPT